LALPTSVARNGQKEPTPLLLKEVIVIAVAEEDDNASPDSITGFVREEVTSLLSDIEVDLET
jgi:hypothetical protein